ncbi:MAG TPA: hypothetical protein VGD37_30765, partial [Kofleriaceae bacterium]
APEILRSDGAARREAHEAEVDADRAAFEAGDATLAFDRRIYGHPSVKAALVAMQHEKCAFCEAKPLHVSDGDVEHFRPKGAVRQADSEPMQRPGYYWLAYDWQNLLFACERCNRRHKKNLFPLSEPARRARSHRDAAAGEAPVFIDPSAEDPERYISFREHVPIAVGGNVRGEQTIDALGLRRPALNADRERHLAQVRHLLAVASNTDVPENLRAQSRALLAKLTAVDAEYSRMSRVAVAALAPPA